jgi:pyruvate dehydrogenase (quinone)
VLRALLQRIRPKTDRSFLEDAQQGMAEWRKSLAEDGARTELPMKPQVVVHALGPLLEDDAILICDCGTNTAWTARYVELRGEQSFSCSGTLATMACALPYAIGAAAAWPGRQIVAVVGDGGLSMLMGDLVTLRKYGFDVKLIVLKNDMLGMIEWEQLAELGNPHFGVALEPIDFAGVARACGLRGVRIEQPALCADQLRDALAAPGACVIEAVVDPNEPPLPAGLDLKRGLHLAKALFRGTKGGGDIARAVGRDVVRELI